MNIVKSFYRWLTRSAEPVVKASTVITNTPDFPWFGTDEVMTDESALKIAAVYRCVDIVSSTVASLGLNVLRRRKETIGTRDAYYYSIDEDSHLNYLLSMRPNSRQTAFDMLKNAVSQILLKGNAYILPRSKGGQITSLILLAPDSVTYDKFANVYHVFDSINLIYGDFGPDEIIHIKNVCTDGGYEGVSTLTFAGKVLSISANTDAQENEMFKSGSTLRGFVSGDSTPTYGYGNIQDEQLEDVSSRVEDQLNSGRRIFQLPGMMKFNQLSLSPADLQLLDSKKFGVLEICRFFGVHPDKVFQSTSTNYKSSENSQTVFMTDTLEPLLRKIENEVNIKLVSPSLMKKIRIKFNLEHYYEADVLSKASYYQKMIQNGTMTPNEVREREGRRPVDGGDTVFISCNVAPINSEKIRGGNMAPEPNNKPDNDDGNKQDQKGV